MNGKICIGCYCILNNASLQCFNCGELQLAFYNKQERKENASKEVQLNSNEKHEQ